jgi:hypothetical protein
MLLSNLRHKRRRSRSDLSETRSFNPHTQIQPQLQLILTLEKAAYLPLNNLTSAIQGSKYGTMTIYDEKDLHVEQLVTIMLYKKGDGYTTV